MTIAERKAREAHDRENPWRPMTDLPPVGLIVDLLFDDMAGHFPAENTTFYLEADGSWYRIDPPGMIWNSPMNWRPSWVKLRPERRRVLQARANKWRNR